MVFSGITFLYYFLPAVVIVYFAAPGRAKNAVLLISSLAFYAWGEQALVFLFAACILIGWISGILMEKARSRRVRKAILISVIALYLCFLGYYKYADFLLSGINSLLGTAIPMTRIALPIGISFYTFQLISYAADVYRGDVRAQRSLIDFAAYISMFPQLIAGPIVRYRDIESRLANRRHTIDGAAAGIRRFLTGLGKKVLIANVLGEVGGYFGASTPRSVLFYWLYAVSYTLQVYYDFSGYSDMAIGLGRIFGFDFPENFSYPYISASITEFWRRWHISLGSWFRDYVYIPLGGNRRGIWIQLRNILIVWLLTGLWHGAAWNFVLWGLYFALLLTAEKLGLRQFLERHRVIAHAYVILAILLGFTLFAASSPAQAFADMAAMLGLSRLPMTTPDALYYLRSYGVIILIAAIGATPLARMIASKLPERFTAAAEPVYLTALLILSTAYLADGSFNPFLYFRF